MVSLVGEGFGLASESAIKGQIRDSGAVLRGAVIGSEVLNISGKKFFLIFGATFQR